jgi:transposase
MLQQGWEVDDIIEALDVSRKSIGRWEDNFERYGTVSQRSSLRGRPRALGAAAIEDIGDLIREAPSLFLEEIAEWLALYHDQPIHTSALHRTLRDLGLTYKALRIAAAERDEVAVAEWLLMVTTNYTAEQCIWLDESSKDDRTLARHFGRALVGERPVEVTPLDRGIRYSILPALSLDGYIALRVVEGSVDGGEFYDFVVNDVVCMFYRGIVSHSA